MDLLDYLNSGQTSVSHLIMDNYPLIDVSDGEFLLWMQLYREQNAGVLMPDFEVIAKRMKINRDVVISRLNAMHKKDLIKVGVKGTQEFLDLSPFIYKIQEELNKQEFSTQDNSALLKLKNAFEEGFGRLLNSVELQKLQEWVDVDKYNPEVILLALQEAVLNNVRNFKYVERILQSWHDHQLTTKDDVLAEQKKRELLKRQNEAQKEYDRRGY